MNDIIYFELNNWSPGKDYPTEEPFITWMGNDLRLKFNNENWVKSNKLCVVAGLVDMSINFCITAPRDWVEENCPKILNDYKNFQRHPDKWGDIIGRFGHDFLEYKEENFGITFVEEI